MADTNTDSEEIDNPEKNLFGVSSSSQSVTAFVNFTSGEAEEDIPVSLYFTYYQSIPATLTFQAPGNQNLLVSVSIGTHIKSLPVSVSFNAASSNDFHAQINIQSLNIAQAGNYGGAISFPAAIQILGLATNEIPVNVNFRQPPINEDILVFLNFTNQFTINAIDVNGNYYPAFIDSTGFFHIDDLMPGSYIVVPSYPNINFNPYQIETNVGTSNALIYFYVNERFDVNSLVASPIVDVCYVNSSTGQAGTYSIEGFILNTSTSYQPLFSIIGDPATAAAYKQTL